MAEGIINISEFPQVNDVLVPAEVEIPSGSNLDDYWISGTYRIKDGSASKEIENTPSDNDWGAKLITIALLTNEGQYSVQLFLNTRGVLWRRYKTGETATPGAWERVTTQGVITSNSLHAVSFDSQNLTSEQKGQALSNLGLSKSTVLYTAQSLTNTQKQQVFTNIGASDLWSPLSVSADSFFSTKPSSSATYSICKSGKTVSFYAYFDGKATKDGVIKAAYRPCNSWAISPLYSLTSPYLPIGSVWFKSDGTVKYYGNAGGYVSATWVCKA